MAKKTSYPMSQRRYVKCGGICCPFCGGGNIEGGEIEMNGVNTTQVVRCLDCDRESVDSYELTGYREQVRGNSARARQIRAAKGGGQ